MTRIHPTKPHTRFVSFSALLLYACVRNYILRGEGILSYKHYTSYTSRDNLNSDILIYKPYRKFIVYLLLYIRYRYGLSSVNIQFDDFEIKSKYDITV